MQINLENQRGIGLLELMLSLLVIAAIIFTATRYFAVANENLRVTQAAEMVNTLVSASYKWVEGQPDFSTITLSDLKNAGLIPTNFTNSNANPWKGSINIKAGSDKNTITIIMDNLSAKGCEGLKEKTQKSAVTIPLCTLNDSGDTSIYAGTF